MDPTANKSSPLLVPGAVAAQKQAASAPMSSSYENQWLAPEEKQRGTSPAGSRGSSDTKQSKASSEAGSPQIAQQNQNQNQQHQQQQQQPPRKSQKDMTKAERRALQEQQRLAKQGRVAAGLPKSAKKAAEMEPTNKKAQQPQQQLEKQTQQSTADDKQKKKARAPKTDQNEVPWLMHLDSPKKPETSSNKDLHPAVLALGLYFSEHKIVGSNARCVAMLETFSKVIEDHRPPADATFARNIQKHLDPHIAYLLGTRPMSLSMRECIRWLKKEISDIVEEDPPLSDDEARSRLIEAIEHFIRERITMADQLIVQNGLQKIQEGEVILTYGKSSVVESLLLETKRKGIDFKVIIVDSRPLLEGKHLLRRLAAAGVDCSYYLLSSVYVALRSVTKVIMGAHALLNNGAVYSRVGTAMVAMAARDKQIPVMICCETYKFVNRTQVDSLVLNEIGNPDELVDTKPVYNSCHQTHPTPTESALSSWREQPNLRLLNLLYDVTPSKYITLVVTEVGLIPCTSAPVIWREYK
ncbi:hypothetical protein INT45_000965 [Circinella minor]|uniref:Translation initiation factor eIF2B subunit delta n=1 Tax=Circinella minor TaxID=1195481 RepID=A0A8H7VGH8_9FUNG|nr:hypothetical protein INT45_000965 [Circinella minor]